MNKYALLAVVGLTAFTADQATKYLAVAQLTSALEGREGLLASLHGFFTEQNLDNDPAEQGRSARTGEGYELIPSYWNFRYVENPGAAWGLLRNLPDGVRVPFFHGVSLVALGFIFGMFRRLEPKQRLLQLSLALVMGGALGNFADRLVRGYVIDFIDWHWRNQPGLRWPTFNVADAAICVGFTLMLLDSLRAPREASVELLRPVEPSP